MVDVSIETAYQVVRILFALSLIGFLVIVVRGTLGDIRSRSQSSDQPSRARRTAELLVVTGEPGSVVPEGIVFPLAGATSIGRSETARVRVDDPSVSAQHALLRPIDGDWVVEDLGSRNGTLVDGRPSYRAVLSCNWVGCDSG
jgi:hypothetical protein